MKTNVDFKGASMKRLLLSVLAAGLSVTAFAATEPLSVDIGGTTFLLPFQKVSATQLYSLTDEKGYPGAQTTLAGWGKPNMDGDQKTHLDFGAAPVLGDSHKVPFVSINTRLSEKFFDTSNNALYFGVWGGHRGDVKHRKRLVNEIGLNASAGLW